MEITYLPLMSSSGITPAQSEAGNDRGPACPANAGAAPLQPATTRLQHGPRTPPPCLHSMLQKRAIAQPPADAAVAGAVVAVAIARQRRRSACRRRLHRASHRSNAAAQKYAANGAQFADACALLQSSLPGGREVMGTGDRRWSCPTPALGEVGDLREGGAGEWGRRREEIGDPFSPYFPQRTMGVGRWGVQYVGPIRLYK